MLSIPYQRLSIFLNKDKKSVRRFIESETFTGSISEKMKSENLKTDIISSLEFDYLFFVSESVKHIER